MNELNHQEGAESPVDEGDIRARFDGIEHASDQQLKALRRLDLKSTRTSCGVVRSGQLAALQGRFPTGSGDPIKAAIAFLREHTTAFGFDLHGRDNAFAAPELAKCDEGSVPEVSTVVFRHLAQSVPTYRGGVAVGVDYGGSVRFARALVPALGLGCAPKRGDAAGARKVAVAFLGDGEMPEPTFEMFDPTLVLGETGRPTGVWVFDIRGRAPIHVLIEDGAEEVLRVITNPGCPIGALPTFHLNRVTSAPDMVLFPGAGLLLPEASTRNPVAVARALFERFPKLFGTGDSASQLALGDVLTGPDLQIPTSTVVFHQRWGILPVFGCQLRVHLSKALAVRSISGNFMRDPKVSTIPTVSQASARVAVSTTAAFDASQGTLEPSHRPPLARRAAKPNSGTQAAACGARANFAASPPSSDERVRHEQDREAGPEGAERLVGLRDLTWPTGGDYTPSPTDRDPRADALRLATEFHRAMKLEPDRAVTIGVPGTEDRGLVILPTSLIRSGQGQNHLAWWFRLRDSDRFVSATTGALVLTLPRLLAAERVFDAANNTSPAIGANPQFIDGNPQVPAANLDPDSQGTASAASNVDAFWRIFRRESWDGRGGNMDAYVDTQFIDANGNPTNNAMWDGSRTLYSPQWATPDIVGHEFTHGLTQATAGLIYMDESGAANEHYSDLFGNLIFPDAVAGQWLVGEAIPTGSLRDMRNPGVGRYQDYLLAQPTVAGDLGGVHTNSGILNRAAVLMCDGDPLTRPDGIGRSRLARLAWETLVFRLHPLASFSDVMHLTWAVSRELADPPALGAPGIPGVAGLPPAFDAAATDTVVWAFQQVGLLLDVQSGWYDVTVNTPFEFVPGTPGFLAVETLYPTPPTPTLTNGRTLADMEVRLFRSGVLNGSMRISTGGTFNAADGSYSAQIISPNNIGTANLQTQVLVTSPTALSVFLSGVPTIAEPAVPQQPAQPPVTPMDTPRVAHWLDVLPFGRRYDDIVFEGVQLPAGCFVTNVELRVIGMANISAPGGDFSYLIASTTAVGVNVGDEHCGAHIVSRTLGGRSLEVKVHSWHDAWVAVRYILRYSVAGNACSLPPFTIRGL